MTNYERIKNMSIKEMAEKYVEETRYQPYASSKPKYISHLSNWYEYDRDEMIKEEIKWLKMEAEQ